MTVRGTPRSSVPPAGPQRVGPSRPLRAKPPKASGRVVPLGPGFGGPPRAIEKLLSAGAGLRGPSWGFRAGGGRGGDLPRGPHVQFAVGSFARGTGEFRATQAGKPETPGVGATRGISLRGVGFPPPRKRRRVGGGRPPPPSAGSRDSPQMGRNFNFGAGGFFVGKQGGPQVFIESRVGDADMGPGAREGGPALASKIFRILRGERRFGGEQGLLFFPFSRLVFGNWRDFCQLLLVGNQSAPAGRSCETPFEVKGEKPMFSRAPPTPGALPRQGGWTKRMGR